jgi:hypothetical protein
MPIIATDIQYRLSGGAANAVPLASIGGIMSSVSAASTVFDDVTSAEATAGDTEYRLVYIQNNHGTLDYITAKIWIQANTPSVSTDVSIGLAAAGLNGTETAVANENTAPAGITFSNTAVDYTTGLSLGTIPAGQHFGVWIKRVVTAGAASVADSFTLRVQGDTNP